MDGPRPRWNQRKGGIFAARQIERAIAVDRRRYREKDHLVSVLFAGISLPDAWSHAERDQESHEGQETLCLWRLRPEGRRYRPAETRR